LHHPSLRWLNPNQNSQQHQGTSFAVVVKKFGLFSPFHLLLTEVSHPENHHSNPLYFDYGEDDDDDTRLEEQRKLRKEHEERVAYKSSLNLLEQTSQASRKSLLVPFLLSGFAKRSLARAIHFFVQALVPPLSPPPPPRSRRQSNWPLQ